ncbi:hypothetical protein HNQ59_003994, partial [Chitinivorax tropicus]
KPNSRFLAADVTGDGRTDVVQLWRNDAGQAVATLWASNGSGYSKQSDSILGQWRDDAVYRLSDQDGDRRVDLIGTWVENDGRQVIASWRSDGSQFVQRGDWRKDTRFLEADFNGDGRQDLLEIRHDVNGDAVAKQWLANGAGYSEGPSVVLGRWQADAQYLTGDLNGDGQSDLLSIVKREDGQAIATLWQQGTAGLVKGQDVELGRWVVGTRYVLGDANADRKADLWGVSTTPLDVNKVEVTCWSQVAGSFVKRSDVEYGRPIANLNRLAVGDVNGDGRGELIAVFYLADQSRHDFAVFAMAADQKLTVWGDYWSRQYGGHSFIVDTDGDGRTDVLEVVNFKDGTFGLTKLTGNVSNQLAIGTDLSLGAGKPGSRFLAGEVTGDRRSDVVQLWRNDAGQAVATLWASNGSGYSKQSDSILGQWRDDAVYRLSDQDGDRRVDLIGTWVENDGRQVIASWRSDGSQFVQRGDWRKDTRFLEADFNGDGRQDLLEIRHDVNGDAVAKQWLANGAGYSEGPSVVLGRWQADA